LVAACLLLAALLLGRDTLPILILRRRTVLPSTQARLAAALLAGGTLMCVATGLTFVIMSVAADTGFGSLTETGGVPARDGGARQPPTHLVVRRVGIDTTVVRLDIVGGAWQVPSFSAGYLAGAPWPGHTGNLVITGHDDQDGAVFRPLSDLRSGDVVVVYAGARAYRYVVMGLRVVAASRVDLLRPTRGATLTLITCAPYLVDTQRLVVRARLLA
jgi:LPXTG-site transpeptidase (sortase) family protein